MQTSRRLHHISHAALPQMNFLSSEGEVLLPGFSSLVFSTPLKMSFFRDIDPQLVFELANCCSIKILNKGEMLFVMGDTANAFFTIQQGWIKLFRMSRNGEETVINILGPGESFAEAAVFSHEHTYLVNAQAVDKVSLIKIPRHIFIQKIKEDGHFALSMLSSIASRQHYLVRQLEQLATRSAPQRIGTFLLHFCQHRPTQNNRLMQITLPYDKSLISTRLHIKPETFSRALGKLKPYGVMVDKNTIIVSDPKRLADFCDI